MVVLELNEETKFITEDSNLLFNHLYSIPHYPRTYFPKLINNGRFLANL